MSSLLDDDDDDLLSDNFKRSNDILDDDLDEEALLFDSGDEDNDEKFLAELESNDFSSRSTDDTIVDNLNKATSDEASNDNNNQILEQSSALLNGSDSEGTDTKDENDDDVEGFAQKKIKIYHPVLNCQPEAKEIISPASTNPEMPDVNAAIADTSLVHDEDDESDEDEKDSRKRFKSERIGGQLSGSVRRGPDSEQRIIPDTLEISDEARQKIEDFDKQEQERRMHRRGKNRGRGKFQTRGPQLRFPHSHPQRGGMPRMMINRGSSQPLFNLSMFSSPNVFTKRPPVSASILMRVPPPPLNLSLPPPSLAIPGILGMPPGRPVLPPHGHFLNQAPPAICPPIALQIPPPIVSLPPLVSEQQPVSTIPVLTVSNRKEDETCQEKNGEKPAGNPIPTLLSAGKRDKNDLSVSEGQTADKIRQVVFNRDDRSSPQLSVKIRRGSRSRSPSPLPRSRHKRTVLKPRRSRSRSPRSRHRGTGRSPSSKKRQRKRSRSYSPKRSTSSRRSDAVSKNTSSTAPRSGKILINPHFKGNRTITGSVALTQSPVSSTTTSSVASIAATSATASLPAFTVPPPIITVPPPRIPAQPGAATALAPKMLVPPPQLPGGIANTSIPKPPPMNTRIPPPAVISVPPPHLLASALAPPQAIDISKPPPPLPNAVISRHNVLSSVSSSIHQPPMTAPVSFEHVNVKNLPISARPGILGPRPISQPTVHIRPVINSTPSAPIQQDFAKMCNYSNGKMVSKQDPPASRLKPPPAVNAGHHQQEKTNAWQSNIDDNEKYQSLLMQQAEKRKKILAMKAERRKGGAYISVPVVETSQPAQNIEKIQPTKVKISNLASETTLESVEKLMKTIGVVENLCLNSQEKTVVGSFSSLEKAEAFAQKYNRFMLDLSYISVSVEQ
ncbi:uncharacterized protein LOC143449281 isoform X2 [Clavelina lepadiformis]|uniref:RRM domain-containing protein n=1 Tax=Clavelina lepadiformis TaxID=159417 RepID=A0ABP0H347_CLALP